MDPEENENREVKEDAAGLQNTPKEDGFGGPTPGEAAMPTETPTADYDYAKECQKDIEWDFDYHPPKPGDVPRFKEIREAGKQFALVIFRNCGDIEYPHLAIQKVHEAVMLANHIIACERVPEDKPQIPDKEPPETAS